MAVALGPQLGLGAAGVMTYVLVRNARRTCRRIVRAQIATATHTATGGIRTAQEGMVLSNNQLQESSIRSLTSR